MSGDMLRLRLVACLRCHGTCSDPAGVLPHTFSCAQVSDVRAHANKLEARMCDMSSSGDSRPGLVLPPELLDQNDLRCRVTVFEIDRSRGDWTIRNGGTGKQAK